MTKSETVLMKKIMPTLAFSLTLAFLTLASLTLTVSCTHSKRIPANDPQYNELGQRVLDQKPITNAEVAELISNNDAFSARYQIWNNPEATSFFMNTFEFEEDAIGLAQIQWAVERAREGKSVHIVLDPAGHRVSKEMQYYMVKNGVNLQMFSPNYSLRGIKHRYKAHRKERGPLTSAFYAVFKQRSYRSHDKVLSNDTGEMIRGGRNANAGHYGINVGRAKDIDRSGREISNPKFEYEHEMYIKSEEVSRQNDTYINDYRHSSYTERVTLPPLEQKVQKAQALKAKEGSSWYAKYAEEKLKGEIRFTAFADDINRWIESYQIAKKRAQGGSGASAEDLAKQWGADSERLTQRLGEIFQKHSANLANLLQNEKLTMKFLEEGMSTVLPAKTMSAIREIAISPAENTDDYKFAVQAMGEIIADKDSGALEKIASKDFNINSFKRFRGPFDHTMTFNKRIASIWAKFSGMTMNLAKIEGIPQRIARNKKFIQDNILTIHDWEKRTVPAQVYARQDQVDDGIFRKQVMTEMAEVVANAEGDVIWNSQYGTPTAEMFDAMDDFLKKNSSVFRLSIEELDRGGVGVREDATRVFHEKFVQLLGANQENALLGMEGAPLFGSTLEAREDSDFNGRKLNEKPRIKSNIKERERFVDAISGMYPGPTGDAIRMEAVEIKARYSDMAPGQRLSESGRKAVEEAYQRIVELASSEQGFQELHAFMAKDKDVLEKHLLNLRGFIDEDPDQVLKPHKKNRLFFMTNDEGSWKVGADKFIHADHQIMLERLAEHSGFRGLGRGLEVYALQGPGRIHSKVLVAGDISVVGSANLDWRSHNKNTETLVVVRNKEIAERHRQHIFGYMYQQPHLIRDGRLLQPSSCASQLTNFILDIGLRKQL